MSVGSLIFPWTPVCSCYKSKQVDTLTIGRMLFTTPQTLCSALAMLGSLQPFPSDV